MSGSKILLRIIAGRPSTNVWVERETPDVENCWKNREGLRPCVLGYPKTRELILTIRESRTSQP